MVMQSGNLWGAILSGGEGTRLHQFIKRLYGIVRPKQYCSIVGRRSMLQHTRDRVRTLIPPDKILTVVNRSHLGYIQTQLNDQPESTILVQPCGRETANGLLLALLHIYDQDQDAVVGVFPSDHFVREEAKFMLYVDLSHRMVRKDGGRIVLLGICPADVEQEYGWIEKDYPVKNPWNVKTHHISKFWEKPDRTTAEILYQQKCLWNTFVMVGKVKSFLSLFQKIVPEIFNKLNKILKFPNPLEREKLLNLIYPSLPPLNFSKVILEKSTEHLCVLEATDIYWSDWGDERRVLRDVERLHLKLYNDNVTLGTTFLHGARGRKAG